MCLRQAFQNFSVCLVNPRIGLAGSLYCRLWSIIYATIIKDHWSPFSIRLNRQPCDEIFVCSFPLEILTLVKVRGKRKVSKCFYFQNWTESCWLCEIVSSMFLLMVSISSAPKLILLLLLRTHFAHTLWFMSLRWNFFWIFDYRKNSFC